MKKLSGLILFVCLCFGCMAAQAEQMHLADKRRIMPGIPAGMEASCTVADGRVDIVIDTYATDWDMVVSGASKSGSLALYPGIMRPDGMERAKSQTDYFRQDGQTAEQSDQQTANLLVNWGNGSGKEYACSQQGWAIGRYDEGTGLFIPEPISSSVGAAFAVCWRDAQGITYTERFNLTVTYSDLVPVYTRRQNVGKTDMKGNVAAYGKSLPSSCISSLEMADGSIVYRLSNPPLNSEFFTAVSAPQWMSVGENWSAYLLDRGQERSMEILDGAAYGLANSCILIPFKAEANNMLYKRDWAIKWVDEFGDVQGVFYVEAQIYIDDPKLTIAYDENVEPMPRANMHWTTQNPLSGLGIAYDTKTGGLNLTIDEDQLPENGTAELAQTMVTVGVDAPSDAVNCRVHMLSGDVIYGDSGEWMRTLGTLAVEAGEPVVIPELTNCIYFRKITATLSNGKEMNYYIKPSMVCDLGGTSLVFEWLNAAGERIGKMQQITLTTDQYQLLEQESAALTDAPDELVDVPTVQTTESGVYVVTAQLPQMGDEVIRYEIELLDQNGNKAQPESAVLVYLPYPNGKTMEEALYDNYEVYHELADGSVELYSVENEKLTLTEQGLCMEVTSFSPYFLNWEEGTAPDASALPETGDSSNLAGYMLLLAVCTACMTLMNRKRAAR